MKTINNVLMGLVVVLIIALGGALYWQNREKEAGYSAVYMDTGDVYFGKLSRFPRMTLRDVWFLQKENEMQQGFGLSKFEKAFWGPKDEMVVNDEHVVWITELKTESEVMQAIKNPQLVAPAQAGMMTQQQSTTSIGMPTGDEQNVQ